MQEEKREIFIDIAKGIAILLMIIGHVIKNFYAIRFIFSFHMPLFIITSGYFFKDRKLKEEVKILFKKLLLPTIIIIFVKEFFTNIFHMSFISSIKECLKVIIVGYSHLSKITFNFNGIGVVWFVYLLVTIRLLFLINKKIFKNNDILLGIVILFETFIGYLIGTKGYWLPWSFDVSLACMIFYFLGYLLKKYKLLDMLFKHYYLIIIPLVVWIMYLKDSWIEIAMRAYRTGIMSYVLAVCGSLVILSLSRLIEKKTHYLGKAFSWCGRNSLYILYGHYLEIGFVNYNLKINNIKLYRGIVASIKVTLSVLFAFVYTRLKQSFKRKIKYT